MMLQVKELSVSFGPIQALCGVSVQIADNQVVCVLGANGAGKSTLIRAISGQVPIRAGNIELDGVRLSGLTVEEVARLGVVQCPEGRQLFETLTVAENLRVGATRLRLPWKRMNDDLEFIVELFPVIRERWNQLALTLSGGEQQMVALARSVIARPRFLMLDELSLGLSPKLAGQVFETIPKIAGRGVTILLAEQNARAALKVASQGYVFGSGKIVCSGESPELRSFLEKAGGYFQDAVRSH
jgi:branched-chain amino acid transport system ATP-binding protein